LRNGLIIQAWQPSFQIVSPSLLLLPLHKIPVVVAADSDSSFGIMNDKRENGWP
jgi:hypothetical protein